MAEQSRHPNRAAGILLPVSCLPSPYGIGSFGPAAYRWVNFLRACGQRYWQVLPLGPTGYGDSPYQSFSAFAGNPYFVDLDLLVDEGLLLPQECRAPDWGEQADRVDYNAVSLGRETILRQAFSRFHADRALAEFRRENAHWVEDYALYMSIKARMGQRPWTQWDEDIRLRRPAALKRWREELREDMDYYAFVQYQFYRQWARLKAHAARRGVRIIGDIPIYVSMDSADAWANSDIFLLDGDGNPIDVAGCPPDAFSADGQLWGNPLYRWDVLAGDGYGWWLERMRSSLELFDVVRIDHFRGFESYYAIPYGSKTAAVGEWRKGPGIDFIRAIQAEFGKSAVIAEDLGYLDAAVRRLLRDSGYPGMKILQFAFDSREESDYMPHNYDRHCVVYTGTHDNDTVRGWFGSADPGDVQKAMDYMGLADEADGNWAFIRTALSSVADLAVIPMQDYLDLGSEARFNIPSTLGGINWRWRMRADALTPALAKKIARLVQVNGRADF